MLFELQFINPVGDSTYRQHQYVDAMIWHVQPDGFWRPRDYLWCETDGVMFVRRSMPTNDLAWCPVNIPPQDSMITVQLQARCRHGALGDQRGKNNPRVKRGARTSLVDPSDNLSWFERTATNIGLRTEATNIDLSERMIDVKRRHHKPLSYHLFKASRFMSWALRHAPEAAGIMLDDEGWTPIEPLLRSLAEHNHAITRDQLDLIVATDDVRRYSLHPDGARVRANFAHSCGIDLGLMPEPIPGPKFALVLANFTAVAVVENAALFEQALTQGVGDSKAFGCGYIHFFQRGN